MTNNYATAQFNEEDTLIRPDRVKGKEIHIEVKEDGLVDNNQTTQLTMKVI